MDALYSFIPPLRGVVSLLLLDRLLELCGIVVLFPQQPTRHGVPQLSTLSRRLFLQGPYGLGYRIQGRDIDQCGPLVFSSSCQVRAGSSSRRNWRTLAGCRCRSISEPVTNATFPRAIKVGDGSICWDMLDLRPFFVLGLAFVVRVDDSFQREHRSPDPRLQKLWSTKITIKIHSSRPTSSLYSMTAR